MNNQRCPRSRVRPYHFPHGRDAELRPAPHSSVCVPCVTAPPARSAAATMFVSASSCSVAPAFFAFLEWISMQYGHCVVSATATAINSLYLSGIAPPLKAASSNATNPLKASGASSPSFLSFVRFFMSYIGALLEKDFPGRAARDGTDDPCRPRRTHCC